MGDNVNLASRLEGITKQYHVQIVISEATYRQVSSQFVCRELDKIRVKGKNLPVNIYELMDVAAEKSKYEKLLEQFDRAMAAYRSQNWREAAALVYRCSAEISGRRAEPGFSGTRHGVLGERAGRRVGRRVRDENEVERARCELFRLVGLAGSRMLPISCYAATPTT